MPVTITMEEHGRTTLPRIGEEVVLFPPIPSTIAEQPVNAVPVTPPTVRAVVDYCTCDFTNSGSWTASTSYRILDDWNDVMAASMASWYGLRQNWGNNSCTYTTTNHSIWIDFHESDGRWKILGGRPLTPSQRLAEILKSRMAPAIHSRRFEIKHPTDIREQRARETLRVMIGDDEYRRFLRNGFLSVRAASGLIYQIYPAHGIACVWKNGVMTERLCVVLNGSFCPTDSLIMRYLLIQHDEDKFRATANKWQPGQRRGYWQQSVPKMLPMVPQGDLVTEFRRLRGVA